ncbi:MAG: serine/threonine-protein kinase [Candidatus Woesebacteria bacterium]|jgi:serine/threonine protein kinase
MEALKPSDPTRIGPYEVEGVVGRGGMGIVYYCTRGATAVAVKVINPNLNYDLEARRRFRREIVAAKKVGGNCVAKVVDEGSDQGMLWYASEFIEGVTLHQAVALERFNDDAFSNLVRGLCKSLREIHGSGIVHRDLKPTNIMIGPRGAVVLDFGISHILGGTAITATGEVIGTANYMSPEHFGIGQVSQASDIFALGSVLVFAATGRPAFGNHQTLATAMRAILDDPPDLRGVSGLARKIIELCLQKDPARRATLDQVEALLPAAKTVVLGNAEWLPPTVKQRVLASTKAYPKPQATRVAPSLAVSVVPDQSRDGSADQTNGRSNADNDEISTTAVAIASIVTLALIVSAVWFVVRPAGWADQIRANSLLGDLPQVEFVPKESGLIDAGSGRTIAVISAESVGYNLLIKASFEGYDVPGAAAAANALCAATSYRGEDEIIKYEGSTSLADPVFVMSDGSMQVSVVFSAALTLSSKVWIGQECDFSQRLNVGYNYYQSSHDTMVLTNQGQSVPVLLLSDEMFVVPSGADGYYYKAHNSDGSTEIVVPQKIITKSKGNVDFDVYLANEGVTEPWLCLKREADKSPESSCSATLVTTHNPVE